MRGAAVLESKCAAPASIEVKLVAWDTKDDPIHVSTFWPFSTEFVGPGKHPISLDYVVRHAPELDGARWSLSINAVESR